MTRNAGPALKRLHDEFGDDVQFLTLYVREAHPGDRYPQPRSFREKLVNARIYRERDRIPWPVAVDDVEGTLHRTLDNKASAVYIVDVDGNVAFRALWSNDYRTLRQALVSTLDTAHGPVGQRENDVLPMIRGVGELYDTLRFAGGFAKRDVLRETPGIYAVARLAAMFRPFPPLVRVVLAMTGIGVAAGIGAAMLVKRIPSTGRKG